MGSLIFDQLQRTAGALIPESHQHTKQPLAETPQDQDHGGRRGPELTSQLFLLAKDLNQCPSEGALDSNP